MLSVTEAAALVCLGRIAIHRGDLSQARKTRNIAHVMLERGAPSVRRHAVWLLALHADATSNPNEVQRWLTALGHDQRLTILPRFPIDVTDDARLVHMAVKTNDRALAEHVAAAADRRARSNPEIRSLAAAAAHARGVLDTDTAELARAADLFTDPHRPLALGAALEDLGVAAAAAGDTANAVEALNRALITLVEIGASWDAARLRGRLRTLGVRRRLVTAQRATHGWAALTESERNVTRLVAEGLTNREISERLFISPHTVSGHLRSIFNKLSIKSRVELTRLAAIHDSPH